MTAPILASLSVQYPLKPMPTLKRRVTLLQRSFVEGDTKPDDWRAWTDEQTVSYSKAVKRVLIHHQVTPPWSSLTFLTL